VAALVEGGRQREVAIAVAEATCATDSGLAARAAALDAEHGEAVRREHADAVATRDRLRREALPRARAALQDH
jgi:hypothetical protein